MKSLGVSKEDKVYYQYLLIMKKSILNLGVTLTKKTQRQINGGKIYCTTHNQCPANQCCQSPPAANSGFCGPMDNNQGLCNGTLPFISF